MSEIAQRAGIGRATLYKHFADIQTLVTAWHHRQIAAHLAELSEARHRPGTAMERLEAVLRAWAGIVRGSRTHQGSGVAVLLHQDPHVAPAQQHLHDLVRDVVADAAAAGEVRGDVPTEQLAAFALHALTATADDDPAAPVDHLVSLTLAGMRPT